MDFSCFIEGATNCTAINTVEDQLLEGPEAFEINIEEDPNFLEALLFHNDIQVTINDQGNIEVAGSIVHPNECPQVHNFIVRDAKTAFFTLQIHWRQPLI